MSVQTARKKHGRAAHLGPERRRPQALDTALKLIAADGIQAVNMESVARAMGVTKPSLYSCFGSREDLLAALLAREEQRLFAGVMGALPRGLELADPRRCMAEGFRALFQVVADNTDSWRLVLAASTDPAVAARHAEARRLVAERVAKLVTAWLALRRVPKPATRVPVLVELFMSVCEGMIRALIEGRVAQSPEALGTYVGQLVLSAFQNA